MVACSSLPCCACLDVITRRTLREGESQEEHARKLTLVPVLAICAIVCTFTQFHLQVSGKEVGTAAWLASTYQTLCFNGLLAIVLWTRRLSMLMTEAFLLSMILPILLQDWYVAAMPDGLRSWSLLILTVDGCLVFDARPALSIITVVVTICWLCMTGTEDAVRWGLYDVSLVNGEDIRKSKTDNCNCADPPCANFEQGMYFFIISSMVFVVDYILTRGFATTTRQAIAVSQRIALFLADMDIEGAEAAVGGEEAMQLPPQLRTAFASILHNLALWKETEERRRALLEAERDRRNMCTVVNAEEQARKLGHPMVLTPAETFLSLPRLTSYEQLRDNNQLIVIDTEAKLFEFKERNTIIFLSHQWLAWGTPDPDNIHYTAMKQAVRKVAAKCPPKAKGRDVGSSVEVREVTDLGADRGGSMSGVYVWADFSSIAQEHRGMQLMAISALPLYSSQADAFVVVAPNATHRNLDLVCNLESYNMRGWCRAEMLSKVLGSGLNNFYVLQSTDGEVMEVTSEWLDRLSLSVFDGDFSCCAMGHKGTQTCDKEALMPAILGLYSLVLKRVQDLAKQGGAPPHAPQPQAADTPPEPAGVPKLGPLAGTLRKRYRSMRSMRSKSTNSPSRRPTEARADSPARAFDALAEGLMNSDDPAVQRMMREKESFFPRKFTFRSCDGWEEERELFGIMLELMEDHVAEPERALARLRERRRRSSFQSEPPDSPLASIMGRSPTFNNTMSGAESSTLNLQLIDSANRASPQATPLRSPLALPLRMPGALAHGSSPTAAAKRGAPAPSPPSADGGCAVPLVPQAPPPGAAHPAKRRVATAAGSPQSGKRDPRPGAGPPRPSAEQAS